MNRTRLLYNIVVIGLAVVIVAFADEHTRRHAQFASRDEGILDLDTHADLHDHPNRHPSNEYPYQDTARHVNRIASGPG